MRTPEAADLTSGEKSALVDARPFRCRIPPRENHHEHRGSVGGWMGPSSTSTHNRHKSLAFRAKPQANYGP